VATTLERRLCQVVGLNQNYSSAAGTLYHIQVEDRGPVVDRISEKEVRRVNVIVYANYGEPNARIIHGRDHDLPDVRTHEHNRFVTQKIQELAQEARAIIEDREQRQVFQIKCLIYHYYRTKSESVKKEFEEVNALYPFLFSRAWHEIRQERAGASAAEAVAAAAAPAPTPPEPEPEAPPTEVLYPLDPELRQRVMEIERVIIELGQDLHRVRQQGGADDILLQTCRKLVQRAKESLAGREPSEFTARRLDLTRNSLITTWRQVRSRIRA
jgi:pyruvate/2-oxoglutarate dehydrogenase complex dihydrolipoamide acyltransferase (E2) component